MNNTTNYLDVLELAESGVGFDISKNHTGVVIWDKSVGYTLEYGFALNDYNLDDINSHAEYEMRKEFKDKLTPIVNGRHFQYAVVEDAYGGNNFHTVRVLLALNTVVDELIHDGVFSVEQFYRIKEPVWRSGLRIVAPPKMKGLNSKVEVQDALNTLGYLYYTHHQNDAPKVKKEIFFEDICDAAGMLMGIIAANSENRLGKKANSIKSASLQLKYVNSEAEFTKITKRSGKSVKEFNLNTVNLEKSVKNALLENPDVCGYMILPSSKLGALGLKKKFTYFPATDTCYFIFWLKD